MAATARLTLTVLGIILICAFSQLHFAISEGIDGEYLCGKCLCDSKQKQMMCDGLDLQTFSVEEGNWSWVETIDLSDNDLSSMPDLSMFTNLKRLRLTSNHRISSLRDGSFSGLRKLQSVDLSWLNLTFGNGTIHPNVFSSMNLTQLRIKQQVAPDNQTDYSFLLPVKESLVELFIVGTPRLVEIFGEKFPKLQNLSLGGENCVLHSLSNNSFAALQSLSLAKLSLRNCKTHSISTNFFRPLAQSLKKLDVSCNPIHESLGNIASGLKDGSLLTFIGDYINHKNHKCRWNLTSEYILPTLEIISLQGNQIAYFVQGNSTKYMKNLQYLDVSYNVLPGAPYNNLKTQCIENRLFCNVAPIHNIKFIGIDSIIRSNFDCGQSPHDFSCNQESELFIDDTFDWQHVTHPDYLDVFVLYTLFETINETVERDIDVYIDNNFNTSFLNHMSFIRIFVESVNRHPETGISFHDMLATVFTNIKVNGNWNTQVLRILAKYLCERNHIKVTIESLTTWARLALNNTSAIWTDRAINVTIHNICKRDDWHYGVDFLTDSSFHVFFTYLTTFRARENDLIVFGRSCSDLTFYYNNIRHVDFSHSIIPTVVCTNTSGSNAIRTVICKDCQLESLHWISLQLLPNLSYLDITKNKLGKRLQNTKLFKDSPNLATLKLGKQSPDVGYFKHEDMFSHQRNLSELDLNGCGIQTWNISLKNNTALKTLNLTGNSIYSIGPNFRNDLEQLHNISGLKVSLQGNPFNCTCSQPNIDMVHWLISSKLVADRQKLKCGGPISTSLIDFHDRCDGSKFHWRMIAFGAVGVSAAVVLFIIMGFLTRKVISSHRRRGYTRLPSGSLPTVFISFPQRMTDDVNALKEMTQDRLVLLSSCWDLLDGQLISSGLSDIILRTTKFILIVSEDYFLDDVTSREYRIMDNAGLVKGDRVVLILTSPNFSNQLPPVLKNLYERGQFFVWPRGFCTEHGFKQLVQKIIRIIQ